MAVEIQSPANVADFRFRVDGYEKDDLLVTAFTGTEGIGQLFDLRIRLCSDDASITPESMLGRAAALEIEGEHGVRVIHGIVQSFGRIGEGSSLTHYEAQLVPPHWLLTRRIQSRVFNERRCKRMDVIGIVSKVLADAGLTADELKVATAREYEPREFVVQYRESDWDFISRLLEEEGIYYFFEQSSEGCTLVLMDSKDLHATFVPDGYDVPFRTVNGLVEEHEFVYSAQLSGQMHIGTVSLDDFNFRQPGQELLLSAAGDRFTSLSLTDYPGGYVENGRGRRLVETRLEERHCEERELTLAATVRGFWPGSRFTLIEHPDERFNVDYLITSMTQRATQSQSGEEEGEGGPGCRYEADLRAIPADVQLRSPRVTPRPTVLGSQTAIVVGPPGEEIHTDEYGRVEVRFHWDQEGPHDVGASCWIRVSQGWAGGQYGMIFLPRVGQEVIVDFLEGDPDQPIVTGRVYNGDHMPPYKLPDKRTISTIRTCTSPGAQGGNEIRFDDAKGSEQLLLFAQDSLHFRARGNRYESVGGDAHETVSGDDFESVKKNRHTKINLDYRQEVNGTVHQRVGGDLLTFGFGKQETRVAGLYKILSRDGAIELTARTSITLFVGGNFIKIDDSGVTIVGKMVNINSGGTAEYSGDFSDVLSADAPRAADTTGSGHNTRYSAELIASDGGDAAEKKQTSWIEIELVDELGQPVAGEAYTIKLPDGEQLYGTLDGRGCAHVAVPDPGMCEVSFPALDAAAWERTT